MRATMSVAARTWATSSSGMGTAGGYRPAGDRVGPRHPGSAGVQCPGAGAQCLVEPGFFPLRAPAPLRVAFTALEAPKRSPFAATPAPGAAPFALAGLGRPADR